MISGVRSIENGVENGAGSSDIWIGRISTYPAIDYNAPVDRNPMVS